MSSDHVSIFVSFSTGRLLRRSARKYIPASFAYCPRCSQPSLQEPFMKSRYLLVMFVLALGVNPHANAVSDNQWATISDVSAGVLIGSALVVVPVVHDDWPGFRQAGLSIGVAGGLAVLGKAVVHEERPDNSDNKSFPSGHTALAFASATTMYRRYGWEYAVPAYALATLTGVARVAAEKHHWWDAVAGAAIGGGSGWLFTEPFNDKVRLVPWADSKGAGILVGVTW
jgi:membrane-associated phospholipid phosphatase